MKIIIKRVKTHSIELFLMILVLIYAWRLPVIRVPVYRIIYALALLVQSSYKKRSNILLSSPIGITGVMWIVIGLWGIILIPFTYYRGINVEELLWLFYFLLCSYVIYNYSNHYGVDSIIQKYILISFMIAILGLYESFTGHIVHVTAGSYYYRKNFFGFTAPNTIFYNINDNAVFMSLSLFLMWVYAADKKEKWKYKALALVLYGVNVLMVFSRGAILSIIAFLLLELLQTRQWNKYIMRIGIVVVTIALVSPFLIEGGIVPGDIASEGRYAIWINIISQIKSDFILGLGAGNISTIDVSSLSSHIVDAHNFFLEIAANYGIIGLASILSWYVGIMKIARNLGKEDRKCQTIWNALVCFIPLSVVSSSLIGKSWVICFFALITSQLNESYTKARYA